jgi:quercetin dioxygenase-like cupin family protein
MFARHEDADWRMPLPGIRMRTLCHGDKTLMTEFRLQAGAELPSHVHPYEQTGYLVSGAIRLTIGDETHELAPGDSWCISGDMPHGAQILTEAVAIEVFSPVREDYLP